MGDGHVEVCGGRGGRTPNRQAVIPLIVRSGEAVARLWVEHDHGYGNACLKVRRLEGSPSGPIEESMRRFDMDPRALKRQSRW